MKIKRMMKNKKAFSAVIAALILMLLAVAAGAVVYAYVMGWIGGVQQNTPNTGIMQFDSLTATADSTNATVTAYVRNTGSTALTISSVYVAGVDETSSATFTASLPVQGSQGITIIDLSLNANQFYEVKVVCTDGTQVSQSVEAK